MTAAINERLVTHDQPQVRGRGHVRFRRRQHERGVYHKGPSAELMNKIAVSPALSCELLSERH
jgi:hypothetical protein